MNFVCWVATIMIALMTSATAQQCPSVHKPVMQMLWKWDGLAWKRVREPCLDPTKDQLIEQEMKRAKEQLLRQLLQQLNDAGQHRLER